MTITFPPETLEGLERAVNFSTPQDPAYLLTHEDRESRRWEIYWRTRGNHGGGRVFAWEWPDRDEDLPSAWGQFREMELIVASAFTEMVIRKRWERLYS